MGSEACERAAERVEFYYTIYEFSGRVIAMPNECEGRAHWSTNGPPSTAKIGSYEP